VESLRNIIPYFPTNATIIVETSNSLQFEQIYKILSDNEFKLVIQTPSQNAILDVKAEAMKYGKSSVITIKNGPLSTNFIRSVTESLFILEYDLTSNLLYNSAIQTQKNDSHLRPIETSRSYFMIKAWFNEAQYIIGKHPSYCVYSNRRFNLYHSEVWNSFFLFANSINDMNGGSGPGLFTGKGSASFYILKMKLAEVFNRKEYKNSALDQRKTTSFRMLG